MIPFQRATIATARPGGTESPQRVSISVFVPDRNNPEGRLVAANMRPGDLIGLPEGPYHIVSTLADTGSGATGANHRDDDRAG